MERLTATPVMLRGIPFFQGVPEEDLAALAGRFQVEHYRRGAQLAGRDQACLERYRARTYFVCRGVVALYTLTRNRSRKILFFLGSGRLLSHNVMGTRPQTLYGEAAADSILLSIPREEFAQLVQSTPCLTSALLAHYETDLWRMSHQLKNTAGYLPVERKMAIKLLKLSQEFGVSSSQGLAICFPLTVTQLADFMGIPRETASRACKRLVEGGFVSYQDRRFVILDQERLEAYYHGTI